jgi:hypothetical protein
MDLSPLCPPALPEGRKRIFPKDNDISSQITRISSREIPCRATSFFKLTPELFINVVGINKEH